MTLLLTWHHLARDGLVRSETHLIQVEEAVERALRSEILREIVIGPLDVSEAQARLRAKRPL